MDCVRECVDVAVPVSVCVCVCVGGGYFCVSIQAIKFGFEPTSLLSFPSDCQINQVLSSSGRTNVEVPK